MNIDTTLISVVIPTRNRQEMLGGAVHSALTQDGVNIEVIVVDDASTDDTSSLLAEWQEKDRRLNVIRMLTPQGGSAARNAAIRQASGELVAFLDDDDWWSITDKLRLQLAKFVDGDPSLGLVYGGYQYFHTQSNKVVVSRIPSQGGGVYDAMLWENWINTSTVVMKRHCFDECGLFDETLQSAQDRDLWIRLARRFSFDFIPVICAVSRVHKAQISTNRVGRIQGRERMLAKYMDELSQRPRTLARWYMALGHMCLANAEDKKGYEYLQRAMKTDPTYWKAVIWWLLAKAGLYHASRSVRRPMF